MEHGYVLPDHLRKHLRVVFCGTVAGNRSAEVGHYYAGPGNEFWSLLYDAGIISAPLSCSEDARAPEFGVGLTDLGKYVSSSSDVGMEQHFDAREFLARMARCSPAWIAFNGKPAASFVRHELGEGRDVRLGRQTWTVQKIPVFVLPSSSAANRGTKHLAGRANRLDWYRELAALLP
jgi:TDG/mug DNA glycosylase family protein